MENKSSKVFVCCFYRKHLRANWLDPAKLYLVSNCQKHLNSSFYTTVKEKLLQLIQKQWALLLYKLVKLTHARFQFHLCLFYKKEERLTITVPFLKHYKIHLMSHNKFEKAIFIPFPDQDPDILTKILGGHLKP